uniref:Uncharacterized protein n=1 Tax=Glossina palpalis gambiensis TaxID=67801 RepID=A0A1B0B377_9MUSC
MLFCTLHLTEGRIEQTLDSGHRLGKEDYDLTRENKGKNNSLGCGAEDGKAGVFYVFPPRGPNGMGKGAIERETSRSLVFSLSPSGGLLREDFSSSIISSKGS